MIKRLAFCVLSFALVCGCQNRPLYKDNRVMMGTFIEVISPDARAPVIVFEEIKRLENLLSKYKPDSEISKLNSLGSLKASRDTFYIIKKSKQFCKISGGAFDITVAPLVELWGFADKKYRLPGDEEIRESLVLVGSDKIIMQDSDNMVKFSFPKMKIDLGGIAKGYALDCAAKRLKENNIKSCLINAGGQIYCLGDKYGEPWKIAIKNPRGAGVLQRLELKDKSVSTSGDYQQFFIKEKKRFSHIFNPKTGFPVDSGIISVTVIADDGLTADALSTAVFVLGKEKGLKLVSKFKNAKVFINAGNN